MPGKFDYKITNKQQFQKIILTDHMKNLFLKFKAEETVIKLSYSTFCRLRNTHCLLVSYATRTTCLCIKHQNMALKLRCLVKSKIVTTDNPDQFIKDFSEDYDVSALFPPNCGPFQFQAWTSYNR